MVYSLRAWLDLPVLGHDAMDTATVPWAEIFDVILTTVPYVWRSVVAMRSTDL